MKPHFNVLSISADEQVHRIVETQLAVLGHTVFCSSTAEEGKEYACAHQPDIIFLDVSTSNNATVLVHAIRECRTESFTPYVIALVSVGDTHIQEYLFAEGVDDILPGPISLLKVNIRFHIALRHIQQQEELRKELHSIQTESHRVRSMYELGGTGIFQVDIISGCVKEANSAAAALLAIHPPLKGISLAHIIGDDATTEYFTQYVIENGSISDYELSIEDGNGARRWLLLSGFYSSNDYALHCLLFDVTNNKNIASDREDLLVRLSRQRQELQEKNNLLTQAHEEIKLHHARLFEQAMRIEESNANLEHSMTQLQRMNSELAEKKLELETTVKRLSDTQTQLIHSERMNGIGSMTAGVMHEINNPNGACYAALQDAQRGIEDFQQLLLSMIPPEEHESPGVQKLHHKIKDILSVLHIATDSSERISRTVHTLQNFSGFQRAEIQHSSVLDILDSAVRLFHYKYIGISVHIHVSHHTPEVRGNIGELNQVFLNILNNAAQAEASEINISITEEKDSVCLEIGDNGKGIAPHLIEKIFDPFFSTKGAHHSGVGLSICKHIIERHGGRIEVESLPDISTRFKISLPCADTLAQETPALLATTEIGTGV